MKITSHMLDTSRAEGLDERFGNPFRFLALLAACISLVVPAAAWGDVYKWTDAKGIIVLSDVLPKAGDKVKNFEVVAKAAPPETNARSQAATSQSRHFSAELKH